MAIPPQVTHNSPQSSPHLTAPTMSVCRDCRCNPCLVLLHQDALTGQLSVLNNSMSSSHKRNVLYRCFVRTEYGVLGRRNLVCIPLCIVKFIRSICPSDDGRYTGHQTVEGGDDVDDDESVEDDTANTSYEKIQEEASPKHVCFDDGEKIRLSLYFRDSQFSAEYVRQFILQSPTDGWQITYQQELFTTATFLCEDEHTYKSLWMFCFSKVKECTKFSSNVITFNK